MSNSDRRYDLDWVRVITIIVVFVFHCGRFFDFTQWHLKNDQLYFPIDAFNFFANLWQMPLLFLVSGAAAWFSLGTRNAGRFVNERVGRLLVPLAFGILVIVPPQVYFERIYKHQFDGSFIAFYPHFFQGIYSYSGQGNFSWHHLWFLAYLFVITLIVLPLLVYLRSKKGRDLIDRLLSFSSKPGAIFVYILPMWLFLAALQPLFPGGEQNLIYDWAFVLNYLCYFVYGYLFCTDRRLWDTVEKRRYIALVLALAASTAIAYLELSKSIPSIGYSAGRIGVMGLWTLCNWCWILTFLGFSRKCLSFSNRFLKYASKAVLPFYILHHLVIMSVGYYVIQWNIPVLAKYVSIIAISFVLIMLIYEFIAKRTNVTRFLFGMRQKPKAIKPAEARQYRDFR